MKIANWFYCLIHLCNRNTRIGAMGLCLFIAVVATYLFRLLHRYVHKKLLKKQLRLIDSFIIELYWPMIIFIWLWAVYTIIELGYPDPSSANSDIVLSNLSLKAFINLQRLLIFIGANWIFLSLASFLENFLVYVKSIKKGYAHIIGRSLRLLGFTLIFLLLLPRLGIDTSRIWAFGGGSAVLVGLTIQPILRNYLGGLTIYIDNLFEENDLIALPEKDMRGFVRNIGWRSTFLEQLDGSLIAIPNDIFATVSVVNITRQKVRRVYKVLTIREQDLPLMPMILAKMRDLISTHKQVDRSRFAMVNMLGSSGQGLEITITFYTKSKSIVMHRMTWEAILLAIIEIINEAGGQLNQPPKEVHVDNNRFDMSVF
ncbi:MAG: mechanosensitive ion channel domain-containing protein [Bacteroidota bacterium]